MMLLLLLLFIVPASCTLLRLQLLPEEFPRTKVGSPPVLLTLMMELIEENSNNGSIGHTTEVLLPENRTQHSLKFQLKTDYPNIISFSNDSIEVTVDELNYASEAGEPLNVSVSVDSWLLGYYNLDIYLEEEPIIQQYQMIYSRQNSGVDFVFTIVLAIAIAIIVANMGCQLDLNLIKSVLVRPIGPAVGFCSQFFFMPLVSFGIGRVLFTSPLYQLGLFALGSCPGGTMSNFWTVILDGDVNLSITMTFISTVAALGMMPLWLWALGRFIIVKNKSLQVPYMNLAISLVMLTIPLMIGFTVKWKRPKVADFITRRVMKPITIIFIGILIPFSIYNMQHMVYMMTWRMFVAGTVVAYGGYAFGATFAYLFRLERKQIIAISLETAFQNGSICFVLLKLSLPEPEQDLAALPAIAQFSVVGPPLWAILVIKTLYGKYQKRKKKDEKSRNENEMTDTKEKHATVNEGFS